MNKDQLTRCIEYKGWSIVPEFDCKTNKVVHVTILNEKIGIAHRLTRKSYMVASEWIRTYSNIWGSTSETQYEKRYYENDTMNDLIEETKRMVDFYELMKESILKETNIIEVPFGFKKFEMKEYSKND